MHSFLVSLSIVALAEIGDKTQILSLILASRYRKPIPITLGVLTATLVSQALAGGIGRLLSSLINPVWLNWAIVASFMIMAYWILVPDNPDAPETSFSRKQWGIYNTALITFLLAEMGDKTQIATLALAAHYHNFLLVVSGATLGMMFANVPVIYLGHRFSGALPQKMIRFGTALIFVIMGGFALHHALTHPASMPG